MANGIFVIHKETDGVIAIAEARFNPEIHTKLAPPHGDTWSIENPPVVPARDIVAYSPDGEFGASETKSVKRRKAARSEPEEKEEAPAKASKKKGPAKKGKK
jgi:hypothetical protein